MGKIVFDTNVFETDKPLVFPKTEIYVSSMVFMELMTACNDTKELKGYKPIELKKIYHFAKDSIGVTLPNEMGNLIIRKHISDLSNKLEEDTPSTRA